MKKTVSFKNTKPSPAKTYPPQNRRTRWIWDAKHIGWGTGITNLPSLPAGSRKAEIDGRTAVVKILAPILTNNKNRRQMKKITTTLLAVFAAVSFSFGQTEKKHPAPVVNNKVNYTETVTIDSDKKDALYGKAKLWFANTFKSANDVVQLDDKDNGIILGKGTTIKNEMTGLQNVRKTWKFTVKIQVKDGKYKAEIYDIDYTFEMPGNNINASPVIVNLDQYFDDSKNYKDDGTPRNKTAKFGSEANDNFNALLASIKKIMTEKLKSDF